MLTIIQRLSQPYNITPIVPYKNYTNKVMERHFKLHIIELFAIILLLTIYSALFLPLVYYIDFIKIEYVVGLTGIFIFSNFSYGTLHTWWKHRKKYTTEEDAPNVYAYLEDLSEKFGTRKPRLVIFESEVPNAYATDTLPTRPIIALTSSLVQQLDGDELQAVIAHEMSHIRSYDVFFMQFISTFANIIEKAHGFTSRIIREEDDIEKFLFIIPFIITWVNLQIIYLILFFISRVREIVADRDAANTTTPDSMKNALENLSADVDSVSESERRKFQGESALTIVPFEKFQTKLFSTHPSTEKRIRKLQSLNTSEEIVNDESQSNNETTNENNDTSDNENSTSTEEIQSNETMNDTESEEYPTDLSLRNSDNK